MLPVERTEERRDPELDTKRFTIVFVQSFERILLIQLAKSFTSSR